MKIKNIVFLLILLFLSSCNDSPTESNNTNFAGKWNMYGLTDKPVEIEITVNGNVVTFLNRPYTGKFNNITFNGTCHFNNESFGLFIKQITIDSIEWKWEFPDDYFPDSCNCHYTGSRIK